VILVNILGAGESSRLYRRLVTRTGCHRRERVPEPERVRSGLLKIAVTVAPAKTLEPRRRRSSRSWRRSALRVTEAELRKAKNAAQSGTGGSSRTINAKAASLGSFQMMRGDYHALFTSPRALREGDAARRSRIWRGAPSTRKPHGGGLDPRESGGVPMIRARRRFMAILFLTAWMGFPGTSRAIQLPPTRE